MIEQAATALDEAEQQMVAGTGTVNQWKAAKADYDQVSAERAAATRASSAASYAVHQARQALANE